MKCVLCRLIELIDCPCSQGRVLYTVINQVAGNTSGWDVWGLNFNTPLQSYIAVHSPCIYLIFRLDDHISAAFLPWLLTSGFVSASAAILGFVSGE